MKSLFPVRSVRHVVIALSLLCGVSALPAADKLPLETFAKFPAIYHPVISRDGRTLCYGAYVDTPTGVDWAMLFKDMDGGKNYAVDKGGTAIWVSEDRVVYSSYGMASIDRDGRNERGLLGYAREQDLKDQQRLNGGDIIFDRFTGEKEGHVLMTEYDHPPSGGRYGIYLFYPNVVEMDTRTGKFFSVLKNPGKVVGWLCDGTGMIRVGVEFDQGMTRVVFRNTENEMWHVAAGLDWAKRGIRPLHLSADGKLLYLGMVTPEGNWGVYTYDLTKQKMGELILSHSRYDILPYGFSVSQDGFSLDRLVLAPKTREVLGAQYVTDTPKVVWFDPQFAQVQAALDQNFPGRINTIVSMSDNLQRLVVLSWTANDFGTYYLFDLGKKQLKPLFQRAPWIKPELMAEVKPISYKSRDGLTIHGYLTLPRGVEPKKLPLVVNPHGGPFVRDSYDLDFDPQFLASRGYAVLQMNYRGSPGFGEAFYKKGQRNIGRGIQDDIEDGARWAIAQGIADPGRVAIMGGSFGGYSAAIQPMRSPDLYRCAINIAGVTDWKALMKYDNERAAERKQVETDAIGDPVTDAAELDDISPVNHADKLQVPMLLIYGKDDTTVPYTQFTALKAALDKAGKRYEVLTRASEQHGFSNIKNRVEMYKAIEAFLAKNMGPK
ncbi:MAG: S9 family peptidase [Verrucomicrobia bacterium]|nr:S9 family peptidase [Verrucomicrobiota bacterium]